MGMGLFAHRPSLEVVRKNWGGAITRCTNTKYLMVFTAVLYGFYVFISLMWVMFIWVYCNHMMHKLTDKEAPQKSGSHLSNENAAGQCSVAIVLVQGGPKITHPMLVCKGPGPQDVKLSWLT